VTPVFSPFSPRLVASGLLICAALLACDDDPSSTEDVRPVADDVGPEIISRQGDIRVRIEGGLDPASALDPANFVVTNTCTGLRVPGALRIEGDEVIFTPSITLPYLTPLSVRVQNIQNREGFGLEQPFTFVRTTEAPPVTDVSWQQLTSSPTGDPISGVDFVSRTLGYVQTISAELYRTQTGGRLFEAVYKDPNVSLAKGIRATSRDTIYMIAAPNFGGTTFTTYALFRSTNAGLTFDTLFAVSPADMRSLSRERVGTTDILYIGGNLNGFHLTGYRYNARTGEKTIASVPETSIGNGADISPDTTKAVVVGLGIIATNPQRTGGVVYRSTNSGRTLTLGNLPLNTPQLQGAGFVDNTTVLLVGDSSTIIRYNVVTNTGVAITAGVPQTFNDPVSRTVETFTFRKAEFSPTDRQIGWVIGELLRRVPGQPDVRRGVILQTRDGGNTFTRQAVSGVEDLGLGFPSLGEPSDISALATDFVVTGGYNGFLGARIDDTQAAAGACSFATP
jgi:hypothetical protein